MANLHLPLETDRAAGPAQADEDRRASWRYGCGLAALTRVQLTETGERYFAWIHDVSLTGVAFDLLTPLQSGQELVFQLRQSDSERVETRAHVVHTTFADGLCRVGCRFVEPLPQRLLGPILRQLRGDTQ